MKCSTPPARLTPAPRGNSRAGNRETGIGKRRGRSPGTVFRLPFSVYRLLSCRLQPHLVPTMVDGVHESVLLRVLRFEDEVTIRVLGNLLDRLARVVRLDLVDSV